MQESVIRAEVEKKLNVSEHCNFPTRILGGSQRVLPHDRLACQSFSFKQMALRLRLKGSGILRIGGRHLLYVGTYLDVEHFEYTASYLAQFLLYRRCSEFCVYL